MGVDNFDEIVEYLKEEKACIIGIDGINGTGKTTLAEKLSRELGFPHIEIDCYVEKQKDYYVEAICLSGLVKKVQNNERFIIEGICLLQVLGRIGVHPDVLIYVKRMQHGIWVDKEYDKITGENVEDFIKEREESIRLVNRCLSTGEDLNSPALFEEVMRYHASYNPLNKACIFYEYEAKE